MGAAGAVVVGSAVSMGHRRSGLPAEPGARDRLIRAVPAGKPLLPEVDGCDWPAIEEWARAIARDLETVWRPARGRGGPAS